MDKEQNVFFGPVKVGCLSQSLHSGPHAIFVCLHRYKMYTMMILKQNITLVVSGRKQLYWADID